MSSPMYTHHKLLVANRGEIAVRIIRTTHQLGIPTLAIYTPSDALSPHVSLADEAVSLFDALKDDSPDSSTASITESQAYLSASTIVSICKQHAVTLVHPGYGFLSENADFSSLVLEAGITWLGPRPEIIRTMGLKHEARSIAVNAGLSVVPGSEGLLSDVREAAEVASRMGYPVMIKATAGGGGMGLVVCNNEAELEVKFCATQDRAKVLFSHEGLFLERYFPSARHIEVQVFGNGLGHVIHMGERECSVQRRHQKVIEETPSPFLLDRPSVKAEMCIAAVRLCESLKYGSAGTVEFLVDDTSAQFYFLEMNTRIQVEHAITEATHPGLDIVRLMIQQGVAERESPLGGLDPTEYENLAPQRGFAIEGRVYSENPSEMFRPCPGVLQHVLLDIEGADDWLRIDHWVSTGTTITPFFDPLLCKMVVTGSTRAEAISRLVHTLNNCKIQGPPNNMEYLRAICASRVFNEGRATTKFLDTFEFTPNAMNVLAGGLEATVQDLPGRRAGLGIPRSGPMDDNAFRVANLLVGNDPHVEAIEAVTVPGAELKLRFQVPTFVAVTGKNVAVKVDGKMVGLWSQVLVPEGKVLEVGGRVAKAETANGLRVYIAVRGGFPEIPKYLDSKSTSMGLGGYQGRNLSPGDQLALGQCGPDGDEKKHSSFQRVLPQPLLPVYPIDWVIHVLAGPHDDDEFLTSEGVEKFYSTRWKVSTSSNRMGIRLEGPDKILWARKNGGEGGSHPSNILDNGYAFGTINVNGDTPVILTNEGPDMGGYACLCTVASAEMWKLGQFSPGSTVQFSRISWAESMLLRERSDEWLQLVHSAINGFPYEMQAPYRQPSTVIQDPKLHIVSTTLSTHRPKVVFRQAGDSAILVEFGEMTLDFALRARIHAFESEVHRQVIKGVWAFSPCIRSTMCHYDPRIISQADLLAVLMNIEGSLPDSVEKMQFPGRKIRFPIVLDDQWSRDALQRYMRTTRDKAVYLPSNIEYLARNNGLDGGSDEALMKLISSDWLVFGVGFYLACPFLVPIDPRCRLVGQKMNPSRTYTPRGALGIAGPVTAIYPVESPGGYQLYGRTLPAWQTWGKGSEFEPRKPWLLQPFDQVTFEPITEQAYLEIEKEFDAGRYRFKIESTVFSMEEYTTFTASVANETAQFNERKARGVEREETRENQLLHEWEAEKLVHGSQNMPNSSSSDDDPHSTAATITSPLSASIWKIVCTPGDVIQSADDTMIILEAMKTEINLPAGDENIGRTVIGFGKGVSEGGAVRLGDVLVKLE